MRMLSSDRVWEQSRRINYSIHRMNALSCVSLSHCASFLRQTSCSLKTLSSSLRILLDFWTRIVRFCFILPHSQSLYKNSWWVEQPGKQRGWGSVTGGCEVFYAFRNQICIWFYLSSWNLKFVQWYFLISKFSAEFWMCIIVNLYFLHGLVCLLFAHIRLWI